MFDPLQKTSATTVSGVPRVPVLVVPLPASDWQLEVLQAEYHDLCVWPVGDGSMRALQPTFEGEDGSLENVEDFAQLAKMLGRPPTRIEADEWRNSIHAPIIAYWRPILEFAFACRSRAEFEAGLAARFGDVIAARFTHAGK